MTLTMIPVLEGHDPNAVEAWTLEHLSWWYFLRAERLEAERKANEAARRK